MILMHQDVPVAILNDEGIHIKQVLNKKHLPVGVASDIAYLQNGLFSSWKKMRAIPHNRQNYKKLVDKIGPALSPDYIDALKVSLTDTYWFKKNNSEPVGWNEINFYDNGFETDIAKISLFNDDNFLLKTYNSPDLTTDGMLQKGWLSINSVPTLIKHGNLGPNANNQHLLCANEVVASSVSNLMDINHVEYKPVIIGGDTLCACSSFVTDANTDFVNALQIQHSQNLFGLNLYNYFKKLGFENEINNMIVLDTLLHNNDRHEKNFGLLRDAASLEYTSFAPIFDTGSCLGWDNTNNNVYEFDMKPFISSRQKQLNLINYKIDLPEQKEVIQIVKDVYENFTLPEKTFEKAANEIQASYSLVKEHNKVIQAQYSINNRDYECFEEDFFER